MSFILIISVQELLIEQGEICMDIEYFSEPREDGDIQRLYMSLKWYQLPGYTDEEIEKAVKNSFYSVYAYDGLVLVGFGRVVSDGNSVAVLSGLCVRERYRHHGIGAEIVNRLVYYCQSGNYRMNVQLYCEDSLIPWYEALGFERFSMGMIKCIEPLEEPCTIVNHFREIYGIEQIAAVDPDFYWFNFDWFGEFKYFTGLRLDGTEIPCLSMEFGTVGNISFSVNITFDNVSDFEIGCQGIKTPLEGFDIIRTNDLGIDSNEKRFLIRSLEDDDIRFFCENFRIVSVEVKNDKEDNKVG
jgi:GNAT superfamily N-acetyltransferase